MKTWEQFKKWILGVLNRFSNQIIIVFSTTTILIIVAATSLFYTSTTRIIKSEVINSNRVVLWRINKSFDEYVNLIKNFTLNPRFDEKIMVMLTTGKIEYSDDMYINSYIKNMFYSRNDIYGIKLYIPSHKKAYSISRQESKMLTENNINITNLPWYETAKNGKYYLHIDPEIVVDKNGHASFYNNKLFTMYRTIIDVYNQEPLAVIAITCDMSAFNQIISDTADSETGMLYVIDKDNRIFYVSDDTLLQPEIANRVIEGLDNINNAKSDKGSTIGSHLVVYNISDKNSWKMAKLISLEKINSRVGKTRNFFLVIVTAAVFISVMLIMFITKALTSSLGKLAAQMNMAGKGDFKTTVDINGSYEIVCLANQYNSMISKINRLIEEKYIAEIKEKIACLKALETQINPHFLYNALQVISSKAITSKQKDIYRMTEALAFNLRYAFKQEGMVTVDMEMKHIRNYLILQEARFDDRLMVDIRVEENTYDIMIPKISIYTLVENSAEHGLENTIEKILIRINIFIEKDTLEIIVLDDGPGMSQDRLNELRGWFKDEQMLFDSNENIGLRNLYGRIKLLYGDKASLDIESKQGAGTITVMRLPLILEGENKNVQSIDY